MLKIILTEKFLLFSQPLRDDIGPGKKAYDQRMILTFTMLVKPQTQIATYKTAESHEANIPLVNFSYIYSCKEVGTRAYSYTMNQLLNNNNIAQGFLFLTQYHVLAHPHFHYILTEEVERDG